MIRLVKSILFLFAFFLFSAGSVLAQGSPGQNDNVTDMLKADNSGKRHPSALVHFNTKTVFPGKGSIVVDLLSIRGVILYKTLPGSSINA